MFVLRLFRVVWRRPRAAVPRLTVTKCVALIAAASNFLLFSTAQDLPPFPTDRFQNVAQVTRQIDGRPMVETLKEANGSQATVQFRVDGVDRRRPIVAVKVFKHDERERALRELKILRELKAQGVRRVSRLVGEGFEDDEGRVVIVTEYIDETDLFDYIINHGPMSEVQVCTIIRDLLTIVVALANLRPPILHGDLKPDNLVLDAHGNIVLIDFGLAGYIRLDGSTGSANGTANFMAPEVLRLERQTLKSESFSVGAILLALFDGKHRGQFYKRSDAFIRQRVLVTVREWCNEPRFSDRIPAGARSFVLNMLKFDADERYTPQQALEDAWLTKTCPRRQASRAAGCFAGLRALFKKKVGHY